MRYFISKKIVIRSFLLCYLCGLREGNNCVFKDFEISLKEPLVIKYIITYENDENKSGEIKIDRL